MLQRYPLHTTADVHNFERDLEELAVGKRNFVWYHVHTPRQRVEMASTLVSRGMKVMDNVPCWFVVGYRSDVAKETVNTMRLYIVPQQASVHYEWMGKHFGYSKEDIAWYMKEVERCHKNSVSGGRS